MPATGMTWVGCVVGVRVNLEGVAIGNGMLKVADQFGIYPSFGLCYILSDSVPQFSSFLLCLSLPYSLSVFYGMCLCPYIKYHVHVSILYRNYSRLRALAGSHLL